MGVITFGWVGRLIVWRGRQAILGLLLKVIIGRSKMIIPGRRAFLIIFESGLIVFGREKRGILWWRRHLALGVREAPIPGAVFGLAFLRLHPQLCLGPPEGDLRDAGLLRLGN